VEIMIGAACPDLRHVQRSGLRHLHRSLAQITDCE
jgi:hypothetical protein